jgi:hypothetical protein
MMQSSCVCDGDEVVVRFGVDCGQTINVDIHYFVWGVC